MTKEQYLKIFRGAAVAFIGAGLVSALEYAKLADFGPYTPLAQAIAASLVNVAKVAFKI